MTDIILVNFSPGGFKDTFELPPAPLRPHIGLCYLAAVLKKKGFTVKIADQGLHWNWKHTDILNLIIQEKPSVVGISVYTFTLPHVYSFIANLNKLRITNGDFKKLKILLGGPHITSVPDSVFELGGDFGFLGEAEETFPVVCDYLFNGHNGLPEIDGLIYKKGGVIVQTQPAIVAELDSLPFPDYETLVPPPNSRNKISLPVLPVLRSRGCVYNCKYCYTARMKGKRRMRTVPNVLEELQELVLKYNVKFIDFLDELFVLKKEEILDFAENIRKRKIALRWSALMRADELDEGLVRELYSSGCRIIRFGIETGSQKLRYALNKRIPDSTYKNTVALCRKNGIKTFAFFMIGIPSETKEDLEKTLRFIPGLRADYIAMTVTRIMPGTELYEEALKSNTIKNDFLMRFATGEVEYPVYVPDGLTRDYLWSTLRKTTVRFYFNPAYMIKESLFAGDIDLLAYKIPYLLLFLKQIFFGKGF